MSIIGFSIRLLLASIFSFSAFAHFKHPHLFLDHVLAYKLVGGDLAWLAAMIIPAIEIAVSIILLSKINHRLTAIISTSLLTIFLIAQVSVLVRGLEIDCGCFGGLVKRNVGFSSIAFLVALIAMTSFLFLKKLKPNTATVKQSND